MFKQWWDKLGEGKYLLTGFLVFALFIGGAIVIDEYIHRHPKKIEYHDYYQAVDGDSVYHVASCKYIRDASSQDIISYPEWEIFEEEGYVPCLWCKPHDEYLPRSKAKPRIKGIFKGLTENGSIVYRMPDDEEEREILRQKGKL